MMRCINIDWLEVYCLESLQNFPHDALYFESCGWDVDSRPYGTRVFAEMFTLMDKFQQPFLEIRRAPLSAKKDGSRAFMEPLACHLRLHNRTCYFQNAAQLLIDFINQHGFTFMKIRRVDLCLDFERFDSWIIPSHFARNYVREVYWKINQSELSAHCRDQWAVRSWSSLSWGSKKSQVSTKLYCKTKELKEVKDKPYIRQAWALAGLVDDMITLQKTRPNGTIYYPEIWRLEFSMSPDVKNWVLFVDENGGRKQYRSVRNTLELYTDKKCMLDLFESLAYHYFHFKYRRVGVRKDRCPDVYLFKFRQKAEFYKVEHVATASAQTSLLERLRKMLLQYRAIAFDDTTRSAIDKLVSVLDEKIVRQQAVNPQSIIEVQQLRQLLSYRLAGHSDESVEQSIEFLNNLNDIVGNDIF